MILYLESPLLGYLTLTLLNNLIGKLCHLATDYTQNMVVVFTAIKFKDRKSTLKIVPVNKFGCLKLGQHPVDGSQAYLFTQLQQYFINIFSTYMLIPAFLQHLKDLEPWNRNL